MTPGAICKLEVESLEITIFFLITLVLVVIESREMREVSVNAGVRRMLCVFVVIVEM